MKKIILVFTIGLFLSSCDDDCVTFGNCGLVPDSGPCRAAIPRYYFDEEDQKCKEFIWGGCDGVVPFETMEDCAICRCR